MTPRRRALTSVNDRTVRFADSRDVVPALSTTTVPSTWVLITTASTTAPTGGESITTRSNLVTTSFSRFAKAAVWSSSAGFGGTGPQVRTERFGTTVARTF